MTSETAEISDLIKAHFGSLPPPNLAQDLDYFVDQAFEFSHQVVGIGDLKEAWNAFRAWQNPIVDSKSKDWRLFLSWYVFHWCAPLDKSKGISQVVPLAMRFLEDRPNVVSPGIQLLVRSGLEGPLDFYEVHFLPDLGCFYLKSLFLGFERSYAFDKLPLNLCDGDIFLGKIVHLFDDKGIIAGRSPAFGASAKVQISLIRRHLIRATPDVFQKNFSLFESDVFNLYHELISDEP